MTLAEFAKTVRMKPATRRRYVERLGMTAGDGRQPVSPARRFVLRAVDFLHDTFPRPDDVAEVIDEIWADLVEAAAEVVEAVAARAKIPAAQLRVLDRRFVSFSGWSTFVDLDMGGRVVRLSAAPCETIMYDLTAVYLQREKA